MWIYKPGTSEEKIVILDSLQNCRSLKAAGWMKRLIITSDGPIYQNFIFLDGFSGMGMIYYRITNVDVSTALQ